jgi:hypothetical protein
MDQNTLEIKRNEVIEKISKNLAINKLDAETMVRSIEIYCELIVNIMQKK